MRGRPRERSLALALSPLERVWPRLQPQSPTLVVIRSLRLEAVEYSLPSRVAEDARPAPALALSGVATDYRLLPCLPIRAATGGGHFRAWNREPVLGQTDAGAIENQGQWGRAGLTVGRCFTVQARPVGFPGENVKFLAVRDRQRQSSPFNRKGVLWDFGIVRH